MIFLSYFFDAVIAITGALFVWTQLVRPALRGTFLFPLLRPDRRKAEAAAETFQEKTEVDEIKRSIKPPQTTKHSKRGGSR